MPLHNSDSTSLAQRAHTRGKQVVACLKNVVRLLDVSTQKRTQFPAQSQHTQAISSQKASPECEKAVSHNIYILLQHSGRSNRLATATASSLRFKTAVIDWKRGRRLSQALPVMPTSVERQFPDKKNSRDKTAPVVSEQSLKRTMTNQTTNKHDILSL